MMRREENLRPAVLVATLAAAVLGFALRLWQLRQGRDENGLWLGGSTSVLALLALCVIAIVVFWLLSRRAAPRAAYDGNFAPGMASGVGYLAGGVLLTVGGLSAAAMQVGFGRAIGLAALLPAVQLVWHGLCRARGRVPGLLAGCVVVAWLVARIIGDFKSWSTDPAVLDYCFQLFGLLCAMLGLFHASGFSADRGKRRITLFWSMTGVFFCAISLADGGLTACLTYGGLAAALLQNAICLTMPGDGDAESADNDVLNSGDVDLA